MAENNTRSSRMAPRSLSYSYLLRDPLGISTTALITFGTSGPTSNSFHKFILSPRVCLADQSSNRKSRARSCPADERRLHGRDQGVHAGHSSFKVAKDK